MSIFCIFVCGVQLQYVNEICCGSCSTYNFFVPVISIDWFIIIVFLPDNPVQVHRGALLLWHPVSARGPVPGLPPDGPSVWGSVWRCGAAPSWDAAHTLAGHEGQWPVTLQQGQCKYVHYYLHLSSLKHMWSMKSWSSQKSTNCTVYLWDQLVIFTLVGFDYISNMHWTFDVYLCRDKAKLSNIIKHTQPNSYLSPPVIFFSHRLQHALNLLCLFMLGYYKGKLSNVIKSTQPKNC